MQAKQVQYKNTGQLAIKITVGIDPSAVSILKTITGCKRHSKGYWTCLLSYKNAQILLDNGFELCDKISTYLSNKPTELKIPKVKIKGLQGTLRKYQQEGVAFIEMMNGRALIADDMGLGKTIQAIAYLQLHPETRPALIIVPGCVKYKWEREIIKWIPNPGKIQILSGQTPSKRIHGDIVIVNYDIIYYWRMLLYKAGFKIMIADEIQYFKNNSAKRTTVIKRIGKKTKKLIGLSGTPIENRPMELFNFVNMCDAKLFPNAFSFGMTYCAGYHNGYDWVFSGASNLPQLNTILRKHIMIRRLKKDVLKELPNINYSVIPVLLDNKKDYDIAKSQFITFVKESRGSKSSGADTRGETLAQLTALKKMVGVGKIPSIIEWVDDFLLTGEKLVISGWHKDVLKVLYAHYKKISILIDGSVSNKDVLAERFQKENNLKLAIVNMKAGGVGIDLFAAASILVVEYHWTPTMLDQVIARIHRMGQKRKVNAYYMIGLDTIENKLISMLDKKKNIISQAMDGKQVESNILINDLIDFMLNEK